MSNPKGVVFALLAARERRQTAGLLDRGQTLAAAGKDLVGIRLVSDIPHQPVVWRMEHIVQGNRQLDSSQAGGEVTAARADAMDQARAQLGGERG